MGKVRYLREKKGMSMSFIQEKEKKASQEFVVKMFLWLGLSFVILFPIHIQNRYIFS